MFSQKYKIDDNYFYNCLIHNSNITIEQLLKLPNFNLGLLLRKPNLILE